jgi:phosphomannomutase
LNEAFAARVADWIALDPSESDRTTLQALLDAGDEGALWHYFEPPLTFGTAGLRGPEMPGPAGMNRASVRRATQGVVAWLDQLGLDPLAGVVVGRDARHGSESFNDEVVAVLLGAGVRVYEMPRPLPTPLVAYAVRQLGAAAGIMITASHNPPADNGYKLYGSDGSQIIAPHDAVVEAAMAGAGPATLGRRDSDLHTTIAPALLERYQAHMVGRFTVEPNDFPIVYTPLHGVGGAPMLELFARAGYRRVTAVPEQVEPNGDFPTVAFPNPEEPGALDLALALARTRGAQLVIANDPDADRLCVAALATDGAWRVLRGDEVGWILGAQALADAVDGDVVATTIVSSTMLRTMAAAAGVPFVETLTGFKWLSKVAPGHRLAFAYEEALGYGVDAAVGDKDGLSAALAIARIAWGLALDGRTLFDRLDELESRFGVHAGEQISLRVTPPAGREALLATMTRVRQTPPEALGGRTVESVVDLETGTAGLPPTEGLVWRLSGGGRVVVRPSGTEPKLKAYVEVVDHGEDLDLVRSRARAMVAAIASDLRSWLAL